MPFAYYDKLSAARQHIYRKSDSIQTLGIPPGLALRVLITQIGDALKSENRTATQSACQRLVDALLQGYRVPPVRF